MGIEMVDAESVGMSSERVGWARDSSPITS